MNGWVISLQSDHPLLTLDVPQGDVIQKESMKNFRMRNKVYKSRLIKGKVFNLDHTIHHLRRLVHKPKLVSVMLRTTVI